MKRVIPSIALLLLMAVPCLGDDEKSLNGTWIASEATSSGKKQERDLFEGAELIFTDGKYSASLGGATDKGRCTIDTSKKPNTIDMKATEGPGKGITLQGIFERDGDTLKIVFNLETMKRPSDFTSTAENKHFVVIYKRKQ